MFCLLFARRFEAEDKFKYTYSFNPCASFKKGRPNQTESHCQSNVAVSPFSDCKSLTRQHT